MNRKRVQRLMREDNLLCLRKRKFVVTTDSDHPLRVYPNLARQMTLTGVDQLWRADITYVRSSNKRLHWKECPLHFDDALWPAEDEKAPKQCEIEVRVKNAALRIWRIE